MPNILQTAWPSQSETALGWVGFVATVVGMTSNVLFGMMLDRLRRSRYLNILALVGGSLSWVLLCLVLASGFTLPTNLALAYLTTSILNAFLNATMVGGFDWASQLNLGVNEVIVGNVMTAMACAVTAVLLVVIGQLELSMARASWLMAFVTCAGTLLVFFCRDVSPELKTSSSTNLLAHTSDLNHSNNVIGTVPLTQPKISEPNGEVD
jgi:hypothetical protein